MFEVDLADRVDDLICIFEGGNPDTAMDTISMLITGWIIFFFCAVALIKYVYRNFVRKGEGKEGDAKTESLLKDSSNIQKSDSSRLQETAPASATADVNNVSLSTTAATVANRSESTAARRRRLDREQFSQSFDLSDKNKGPCNGPDSVVVEFINRCHEWLYSPPTLQYKEWSDVRESFIDSINKILREDEKTNPVVASVVDIVFKDDMTMSNCFAECEHENTVKVTCDCEAKMTGVLSLYSPDKGTSRHDFFVDRLCGRLNILLDTEEQNSIVKLDGWPEICVGIASNKKINQLDSKLSESIAEKLTAAIRNAVFELELKRFPDFPTAPKISPKKKPDAAKSYLVIKIIRGIDIGLQKSSEEPYCAVELDDPPQKFQTDCQSGHNPYWGENFVFNILPAAGEILFEIFDRVGTKFMGCNILSIDELGDDKTRLIPLKSRRMEISDQISGSLEAQFTFLDEKEFLQKSREIIEKISPNGNLIKTTKTTFTKPPTTQSDLFTEKVIQEFERSAVPNPKKSTLIIHSVQRVEKKSDGRFVQITDGDVKTSPLSVTKDATNEKGTDSALDSTYGEERGRRRTRRGDIFTSIRRRFSKTRSRSVNQDQLEEGTSSDREQGSSLERDVFARSVSVDRDSLMAGRHLGTLGPHSARSSASELSALSGHSTSTFVHENSTLVIECIENRIRKYYLVPPHLAETGKWKKRGKKLHIFNDHTFVAKHIQSGTSCEVCNGRFQFSLGKQGYQCRDCKMRCHKECHVRTTNYCSNTTVYDIELGTAKCVSQTNTFSGVCSAIFSSKKSNNSSATTTASITSATTSLNPITAKVNGKECILGKNTVEKRGSSSVANNSANSKIPKTNPRKKTSIFRKVTRLGKISEENLTSSKNSTVDAKIDSNSCSSLPEQPAEVMEEKSIEDIANYQDEIMTHEAETATEETSSPGSSGNCPNQPISTSPGKETKKNRDVEEKNTSGNSNEGQVEAEVIIEPESVIADKSKIQPESGMETDNEKRKEEKESEIISAAGELEPHMSRSPKTENFAEVLK